MHRKTVVLGSAAAAAMLALSQVGASANMVWCISDPPLQVVTPAGHNVLINNMVYLPPYALHLKSQVVDGAVAVPDGRGGSLVIVHVSIPAGVSAGHVVSSDNRFQVSSQGSGSGGSQVTL